MAISFSGLASGLDTSGWVDALVSVKQDRVKEYQQDLLELKNVKTTLNDTRSSFSSLRTALEKITDVKFGGTFDLFGKNTAKSANESIFTATANANAARQSYDISVQQLATQTKATSLEAASSVADDSTILSNIGITKGTLTVYVNGAKTSIDIEKDDTLGDLKADLATAGIKAEVDETGSLKLSANNEGDSINIGSTTDTSNFVSLIGLAKNEDGTYSSTNSLFKANISSVLTSAESGFREQITLTCHKVQSNTAWVQSDFSLIQCLSFVPCFAAFSSGTWKLNQVTRMVLNVIRN